MNKKKEILKYSNPNLVYNKAKYIFGDDVDIKLSTRKNKKYMLYDPTTNKYVHFGEIGFLDYTKHKDENRRRLFRARNYKWKDNDIFTSSWMSYYLLWS